VASIGTAGPALVGCPYREQRSQPLFLDGTGPEVERPSDRAPLEARRTVADFVAGNGAGHPTEPAEAAQRGTSLR
jgi:hypothetical protein